MKRNNEHRREEVKTAKHVDGVVVTNINARREQGCETRVQATPNVYAESLVSAVVDKTKKPAEPSDGLYSVTSSMRPLALYHPSCAINQGRIRQSGGTR